MSLLILNRVRPNSTHVILLVKKKVGKRVAETRQIKHTIKRLQNIKIWQLILLLILASFVAMTFLRLNNVGMIERRAAVIAADEVGDASVIQDRLYDLQRYVSQHMNTDMGEKGVPLEQTFLRDYEAKLQQVSGGENANRDVFKISNEICRARVSRSLTAHKDCMTTELSKYPAGNDLVEEITLPSEPYYHSFSSPVWSPDFAGWSVIVVAIIVLMIIARITGLLILNLMLHRHYKSI